MRFSTSPSWVSRVDWGTLKPDSMPLFEAVIMTVIEPDSETEPQEMISLQLATFVVSPGSRPTLTQRSKLSPVTRTEVSPPSVTKAYHLSDLPEFQGSDEMEMVVVEVTSPSLFCHHAKKECKYERSFQQSILTVKQLVIWRIFVREKIVHNDVDYDACVARFGDQVIQNIN